MRSGNGRSFLKITDNLRDALEAIREPHEGRLLWVDAVCINQRDPDEKGPQVGMMKDIYRRARKVIVWLGKEDVEVDVSVKRGVAELEAIGRDCDAYGFEKIFPPFPRTVRDPTAFANLQRLARECNLLDLSSVYSADWFQRVWVVQEFILARKLELRYGSCCIDCDHFSKATAVLQLMMRRRAVSQELRQNPTSVFLALWEPGFANAWSFIQQRERYWGMGNTHYQPDQSQTSVYAHEDLEIRPSSMIEYCSLAKNLKCTDERDRVFGMLGFAYDDLDLRPDYRTTPEQVWEALARQTLAHCDLTVLHYAGIPADGPSRVRSFAADFGRWKQKVTRLGGHGHPRFHAATQIPAKVALEPDGCVRVHAIKVDTVNSICDNSNGSASGVDAWSELTVANIPVLIRRMYEWWLSHLRLAGQRWYSDERGKAAFRRTIIADMGLPGTKELCGALSPDALDVMFAVTMVAPMTGDGEVKRMETVDTWQVYDWTKRPIAFGLSRFADDPDAVSYLFPRLCGVDWIDLPWQDSLRTLGYHDLMSNEDQLQRLGLVRGPPPGRIMDITGPILEQLENYFTAVQSILRERRMFFTNVRLLGLGPRGMRPGDVIMVPEGSQTPFVYRPEVRLEDWNGGIRGSVRRGQLVGECYIDGLMDGDPVEKLQADYDESHIEVILT